MKTLTRIVLLTLLCFLIMVVIDFLLGSRAEYINAYSVVQRLVGVEASIAPSLVAQTYGNHGELIAVICLNLITALVIFFFLKTLLKK